MSTEEKMSLKERFQMIFYLVLVFVFMVIVLFMVSFQQNNPFSQNTTQYDLKILKGVSHDLTNNHNFQAYEDFFGEHLLSYEEYASFCEEYDLHKKYWNSDKQYAVICWRNSGWFKEVEVSNIETNNGTCSVMVNVNASGITSGDVGVISLVIPCEKSIKNIDFQVNYQTIDKK